ncbi:peptidase dimerization domain-containing protein [Streptomyces flavotricini]|uniref:peptidase dimerization domain-containing protein n=1 Tax=Streptomyces flavotricini TaxID=66888 RepID=UPI001E380464|nr:peptidase dimerization domain-containing protein [Streptomyces flavotricini]
MTGLQTVVAREAAPSEQVAVTVGSFRAGERANVVPDRAELGVTVRAAGEAALTRAAAAVERIVRAECAAFGDAGRTRHGAQGVRPAYWMLGVIGPAAWSAAPGATAAQKLAVLPANHAPDFAPDVRTARPAGVRALRTAALNCLGSPR